MPEYNYTDIVAALLSLQLIFLPSLVFNLGNRVKEFSGKQEMGKYHYRIILTRKAPCAAMLCCIVNAASADNEWIRCESELIKVYVTDESDLYIHPKFRRDYLKICNLERNHFGISSIACQAWLDMAQTALASNLDIRLMYPREGADGEERECKTLPVYSNAPAPRYFMLSDD